LLVRITTIAKQIGVDRGALNFWLTGKVRPTFRPVLKIRDFLEHQVESRGGIAPVGMSRYGAITQMGEEGRELVEPSAFPVVPSRMRSRSSELAEKTL
jgi:hypothetical protein